MKGSKMKQMKTQLNGQVCNEKKMKWVKRGARWLQGAGEDQEEQRPHKQA